MDVRRRKFIRVNGSADTVSFSYNESRPGLVLHTVNGSAGTRSFTHNLLVLSWHVKMELINRFISLPDPNQKPDPAPEYYSQFYSFTTFVGFQPTPIRGSTKYGTAGRCTEQSLKNLDLPAETLESIAKWSNLGVTKKTWSTYKTAEIMLKKCSVETKICMDLPLTDKQTLVFIDWLARVRNLKCTTINSYLAGIRQLHIVTGLPTPELRTDLVKLVLKGISNENGIAVRSKNWWGRLPMTVNSMLLFKN
jgi:hypothetical protein